MQLNKNVSETIVDNFHKFSIMFKEMYKEAAILYYVSKYSSNLTLPKVRGCFVSTTRTKSEIWTEGN